MKAAFVALAMGPDRALAARLVQRRYRIGARWARRILGLSQHSEVSP